MESARLLLNSEDPRCSTGLGNSSGQLGRNLMDHAYGAAPAAHSCARIDQLRAASQRDLHRAVPEREGQAPRFPAGVWLSGGRRTGRIAQAEERIRQGVQGRAAPAGAGTVEFLDQRLGGMPPREDNLIELHLTLKDKWGLRPQGATPGVPTSGPIKDMQVTAGRNARCRGRDQDPHRRSATIRRATASTRWVPRAWDGIRRPRCSTDRTRSGTRRTCS